MRWMMVALALGVVVGGLAFWFLDGDRMIALWALEGQRTAQELMAGSLRRLRAGQAGAVSGLLAVCFGYGFFHAAGPGHGKLLIGGYGAARQVGVLKLSVVALLSSLSQGMTAVLLVTAGLWVIGLGRAQMTDVADRLFAPLSFGAIAVIGLWLMIRGLWRISREVRYFCGLLAHTCSNDHTHSSLQSRDGGEHICKTCGHAHGPAPEDLVKARGLWEVAALIGAVAIRPCTGALFLLILTAQLGIFGLGILGALAMALGTASITIMVAVASVTLRAGALVGLSDNRTLARVQAVIEALAGAIIATLAIQFALVAL